MTDRRRTNRRDHSSSKNNNFNLIHQVEVRPSAVEFKTIAFLGGELKIYSNGVRRQLRSKYKIFSILFIIICNYAYISQFTMLSTHKLSYSEISYVLHLYIHISCCTYLKGLCIAKMKIPVRAKPLTSVFLQIAPKRCFV